MSGDAARRSFQPQCALMSAQRPIGGWLGHHQRAGLASHPATGVSRFMWLLTCCSTRGEDIRSLPLKERSRSAAVSRRAPWCVILWAGTKAPAPPKLDSEEFRSAQGFTDPSCGRLSVRRSRRGKEHTLWRRNRVDAAFSQRCHRPVPRGSLVLRLRLPKRRRQKRRGSDWSRFPQSVRPLNSWPKSFCGARALPMSNTSRNRGPKGSTRP